MNTFRDIIEWARKYPDGVVIFAELMRKTIEHVGGWEIFRDRLDEIISDEIARDSLITVMKLAALSAVVDKVNIDLTAKSLAHVILVYLSPENRKSLREELDREIEEAKKKGISREDLVNQTLSEIEESARKAGFTFGGSSVRATLQSILPPPPLSESDFE